jgi:hypothetical protein
MLSLEVSTSPDALTDALAGLLAILHPDAGMGSPGAVLEAARGALRRYLRKLRHHFHEHSILLWALREAEPATDESFGLIVALHEELRRISHELCQRLRREEVRRARALARSLLAMLLDHLAQERHLLTEALRGLSAGATRRFADALFERMLGELAARQRETPARDYLADLHSLYVRLIHHLQGRPADPRPPEVANERSCR